jgi:hypothetical protein
MDGLRQMRRCNSLALAAVAALGCWTTADAAAVLQVTPGTGTDFTVTQGNDFPFVTDPFQLLIDGVLETTGAGVVTFEYLGFEAGFTNSFVFNDQLCFRTGVSAEGATCGGQVSGGAVSFAFWSDLGGPNFDAVVWDNGAPPDSILDYSIGIIQEGPNQFLLLWDDSGNKEDDDHDDLGIRITFRPLEQVPEPTSMAVMVAGLAGLAGLRRTRS